MLLALSSVLLVAIQDGNSQKLGESCIVKQTNLRGVCMESCKCQPAIEDYRIRGLIPTFCDSSGDSPIVCCNLPVLNTQEYNDATPILKTTFSSEQNIHIPLSERIGESCIVEYTNSRGKCTESSKCQSAKQDYQKSGIPPTFCNQTDTLTLVCCRDGITILDTEQNKGDNCTVMQTNTRGVCTHASKCQSAIREYQYNRIVPTYCKHSDDLQLVCCTDGITILDTDEVVDETPIVRSTSTDENTTREIIKKEGDSCIVELTGSRGICIKSAKCQSATQEYQHNGIVPTYCKHSDDIQLVCCRDGITILDTQEVKNNTPLLLRSSSNNEDAKDVLSLKIGDTCVEKHTNSRGICTEVSKCISAQQDYQISSIVPTYCKYSDDVQLVCCRDEVLIDKTEKNEEYDDNLDFRSLPTSNQKSFVPLEQKVGDSCLVQHILVTRGVCTEVSNCQSAVREYLNRFIVPTFCNNTETSLVCCKDGISIFTPTEKNKKELASKNSFSAEENTNTRISERKCKEYSEGLFQTVVFIASGARSISAPKCDYAGVGLIVGGENANQGEFPHMAAVGWIGFNDNYVFQCGGSLISPRFVLTAGHCTRSPKMKEPKPSIVRLGDQNLDPRVEDGARPVDVPIKTVYKHPQYHSPEKYNDIALFELNLDVEFEAAIRPACLWTKPDFSGHTKAIATGWGVNDTVKKEPTYELQKVSLSLLKNDFCEVLLEDTHNRNWNGFIESQMCAGELRGGKDTCQGDSGSPLQIVAKENNCIFYIAGITSFGWNCAKAGRPAVYTRVYSYLDWIESIVWPEE
ncbi:unnamed protein product, partial [Brenthis ino]